MDKEARKYLDNLGYFEQKKHRKYAKNNPPERAVIQTSFDKLGMLNAYCCPVCGNVLAECTDKLIILDCPYCGQVCHCFVS